MTMTRIRTACATASVLLLLMSPHALFAAGPSRGSGDVDGDGRLTSRDALMIFQMSGNAALPRLTTIAAACDYDGDGACTIADAYAILAAVTVDPNDTDGDGVPNEQDCNPFDERLSTPHTFYLDLDLDSFGDSHNTVQLCVLAPPPPSVAWGGDPDDTTPFQIPFVVPKSGRLLGLDLVAPAQDGRWRDDLARELGADAATLRAAWSDLETSPGTFNGPFATVLTTANTQFPAEGLRVNLTVNPVSGGFLAMPSDLKSAIEQGTLRLSDQAVIDRFKALLTFVHTQMPDVQLTSLQIGYEVDRFLNASPMRFWADYGVFFAAASAHAKSLWGDGLRVGITATHAALLNEPTRSLLRSLNGLTDEVSLTYLPRSADGGAIEPSQVRLDIEQVIALYYPKPLVLDAVGYPSSPLLGGSTTKQSQFIRAFFDVWDSYAAVMPFASFTRLHDFSLPLANFQALGSIAAGGDVRRETAFQQSLGLRTWDGEGMNKPAYQTLRNMTFARGWWAERPLASRSFGLGFTPALYDFPATAEEYSAMLDWIEQTITTDATTVNFHLDHGVPWVEALADTFASADLPYSPALVAMWQSLRSHLPQGKKLLVSINPLGVPRNVMAPYFGVGEGFTYDNNFKRIGNGIIADGENRLPPGDWNTYALNDEHVKRAFLNYARRAIQFFRPDRLVLAIEVTATMNESPAAYDQLLDLLRYVYTNLKADPSAASVPLGVSISATTFMTDEYGVSFKLEDQPFLKRELQVQGLVDVLPSIDFVALSLYPHYGKYNASTLPASMFDALMPLLEATGKPVMVSETGWPAESYTVLNVPFISDAAKQDAYYRLLFGEMEHARFPVEDVISFAPRDSDLGWQRLLAGSLQNPPTVSANFVEFYKYFRNIGIYDGNGNPRAATDRWKQELALPYTPKAGTGAGAGR
jgi:hypothetical protein